jgi:hypothetical protein
VEESREKGVGHETMMLSPQCSFLGISQPEQIDECVRSNTKIPSQKLILIMIITLMMMAYSAAIHQNPDTKRCQPEYNLVAMI